MGEKFGKFEIITKIATGGMAEIFLARQTGIEGFQKLIVLKRILPHLSTDKEFVNMFLDEARMAAQLNHPNIVQIYDLGVISESYFIAMEYVDGVDLSSILKRGREQKSFLRLGWILKIISQVCEGLHYAHTLRDPNGQSLGLIHRDITPENILLSFNGNVKITDFGIARARGRSTSTTSGTLKGKFPYMSYEMVRGMEIDSRSDIFSLGVVLWEMLTYRRLFKRDTEVASINAILNEEIPSPKKYFKNLPDEVESIVMKALERDREKRFQSTREMGNAIEDFIIKRRVNVRISDLSDYLKKLFPDKEISSVRDKLSSSRLQKIVEIKEHKSASNSLPVITIQKKHPVSESETVVLPPPSPEGLNGGETANDLNISKSEVSEEKLSVSAIKPLSEVMDEIKIEIPQRKEVEDESREDKVAGKEDSDRDDNLTIEASKSEVTETPKSKRKNFLIAGTLIGIFILIGILYFVFITGKKEETQSVISVSTALKEEKKAVDKTDKEKEQIKNEGTLVKVVAEEKTASEPQENSRQEETGKKREQKVAVVERQRAEEKKPEKGKTEDKTDNKQEEKVQTESVEPKKGFVSIDSDPWTEVYLDGKKIGETPLVRYELIAGSYNLLLKNSEFGFEKPLKINVNPEDNTVNKVKFGKGLLNISTNVPAEVRLGGNLLGKTPLSDLDLYEGIYRITLFDPEQKKSKTIKVEIKENKTTSINENL